MMGGGGLGGSGEGGGRRVVHEAVRLGDTASRNCD